MSDMKKKTQQFKLDFADWVWLLREDGETDEGINEIKLAIRNDWANEELKSLWIAFVADQAKFRRELISMSKGITERIKHVANANTSNDR